MLIVSEFFSDNFFGRILFNIICSFAFIIMILYLLRPKIVISDKICIIEKEGEKYYTFKIVNLSKFNAYDLKFSLQKRTPYIVNNNKVNYALKQVPLVRNELFYIPKYNNEKGVGEHAILIATKIDVSQDIDVENLDYELSISAKHGLSNITSVTYKRYENKNCLHIGKFKFGKNLDVI